jgi:hypothetical protein
MVGSLGHLIFGSQKERFVIGGPLHGCDSFRSVGKSFAGPQIFHMQRVLTEASDVSRISQKIRVVAYLEPTQAKIGVALCEFVAVEQDFLGAFHAALAAALHRILFALFSTRVIIIFAAPAGNRKIGLLDAAEHLLVERLFERMQLLGQRFRICVFGLEIFDDLRIRFFAEPKIVVDHGCAVARLAMFDSFGDRWRDSRFGLANQGETQNKKSGERGASVWHRVLTFCNL